MFRRCHPVVRPDPKTDRDIPVQSSGARSPKMSFFAACHLFPAPWTPEIPPHDRLWGGGRVLGPWPDHITQQLDQNRKVTEIPRFKIRAHPRAAGASLASSWAIENMGFQGFGLRRRGASPKRYASVIFAFMYVDVPGERVIPRDRSTSRYRSV